MSQVKLVPNAKLSKTAGQPVYVAPPSATGKTFRVQVQSTADVEIRPGLFATQNRVGFARFMTEEQANRFVGNAALSNYSLQGKVIYVDQLEPIIKENADYGKQYPYPMNHAGKPLDVVTRAAIQDKAIVAGLCLTQSGMPIYRSKVYTEDLGAKDTILSADNMDEVNAFVNGLLSTSSAASVDKAARLAELKAIPKANRTPAQVEELADLVG
jgi:hypothetical protein